MQNFRELIDTEELQSLMEKFTLATNIPTAVMDLDGEIITASGWKTICNDFYRKNSKSAKNCKISDRELANKVKEGSSLNIYECLNGLVDVAVPIKIDGKHMANLFIGQLLYEPPDRKFFEAQADEYNFDKKAFMKALDDIPVISKDDLKNKLEFLSALAAMVGRMGITKLELLNLTNNLEEKIIERTTELKDAQLAALNMMQDIDAAKKETDILNLKLKEMMNELKDSNEQLEQFAYVASHDLQEPLRKIISFTELFSDRFKEIIDEKGKKYMYYIVNGAERMQQLINDLLSFSRINTRGKLFSKINTTEIIDEVVEIFEDKLNQSGGEVIYVDIPDILGDDMQIRQVFQNLIGNSIKFCPSDRSPKIKIYAEETENLWKIIVQDNGIGIDMQYHDRIFTIFQRLHSREAYDGTGIGLAICKQIISRHRGEIYFESEIDKGTTFIFTITKKLDDRNH